MNITLSQVAMKDVLHIFWDCTSSISGNLPSLWQ